MPARALVASVLAVATIVGVRIVQDQAPPRSLITVDQGVSRSFAGSAPVFLSRSGEVLDVFWPRDPGTGDEVLWCPHEDAFVAPATKSLWDAQGRWVAGASRYDLQRVAVSVHPVELTFTIADRPGRRRARSSGTISGEAGARYDRFAHGDKFAGFCKDPLRPR